MQAVVRGKREGVVFGDLLMQGRQGQSPSKEQMFDHTTH